MWLTWLTLTTCWTRQTTKQPRKPPRIIKCRAIVYLMPKIFVSQNAVTVYRPCTNKCSSHNQCAAGTIVPRNVICEARVTPTNFD